MDAQTVRTALFTIQTNPSAADAWQNLSDALFESEGDLSKEEALALLQAARGRHSQRGESDAVARLLELSARLTDDSPEGVALLEELARVFLEELFAGNRAIKILDRAKDAPGAQEATTAKWEALKERAAAYEEQAKTYLAEAENATDDLYRSAMLMRSAEAEVCFSQEPHYSKIVENLELALRLDSSNLPATRLLEAVYRRQADWDGLVRVLERAADRAPDQGARVAAGIRLARLYLHHFDDAAKAASTYDRVLDTDPTQTDAMEFVTEYYSGEQRWDELVRAFEKQLKARKDADESMLGEMLQVAMLHWKKRKAMTDAEPWFERIRRLDPTHDGVLNFYREYKATLDDDAGLVQVLEDALHALSPDDERRAQLEKEIDAHKDEQAGAQKSIERYKSALREDPDDEDARTALKTLYKQTQGHNALVELLRQQLERTPEEDLDKRLAVMREIAAVYRQYVKSDTALVGVLNQIVQLDGKLDEHDVDEVRELVSLYEKLSRPRDLLASQKLLAEIVPDKAEKVALYRQVGRRWLEQFSNVQHAMEAFAALHEIDPDDAEAIERLEDLYRKRRAWKELFALYEQQLTRAEGEARVPLLREMAQLSAERLSRVDDALDFYRQILDIDPSRTEVLDRMEKHAERSKDWPALVEVLERRLALMPHDETRLPVLQKLGSVYGDHLDKSEEAIGAWRRVVDVHPGHPRAMRVLRDTYLKGARFDELEELYVSQKDLEGLVEVLSTAADRNKDPEEKLDLSFRAARIYEAELGQSARAIRSYERILSIEPNNPKAIQRLLPLYEQEEKWARIPPLLEVLIEVGDSVDAKVEVYEQLVSIAGTRLADKKGAVGYARRAFELAPESPRTVEMLDATARAAGSWEDMVEALEDRLKSLGVALSEPPPPVVAKKEPEPEPEKVEEPSDEDEGVQKGRRRRRRRRPRRSAKTSTPPPAEKSSPSSSEAPRLSVPAPALDEPYQRALALRLARVIGEELGRVEDAIGRLKVLAADAPTDPDILSTLDALMRRESRVEDLRWLYNHRQTHSDDPDRKAEILCEWAAYEESTAHSQSEALRIYDLALEVRPDHVVALEAVARLALTQNKPERAVEAIFEHRQLLTGVDAAHKDAMLAELYADRLGKPQEALAAATRALEGGAEPGSVIPVLQQLVEIAEVRGEAARILSEQYEAGGDSRQEADALRALISETSDPVDQIELYKKLADVYELKLSEPGAALSVIVEALRHHPTELELWDRAGPLAGQAGRPTDLADAFREALRKDLGDQLALDLARRAAELHEQVLGDPQGSVPYYEKVLALEPDDEESFLRMKEILTAGERWRELEELYDREVQRLSGDSRGIELLAEVALLAEDIMGDSERAIGYHRRILEHEPENSIALSSLDRLYTRLERKEALAELLQRRAELEVAEEQHGYLIRLAQITLGLHQPVRSMDAIERVLEDDPGSYEARDVAEELLQIASVRVRAARCLELVYESRDEIRDLVRVLGVRVEALRPQEDDELDDVTIAEREDERRDLLRRIATLRDDRLHDDEGSFDVFAELSPLDPVDADLRERLIDSGRRLGRSAKVVEVLLACAKACDGTSLKAEILLQAAKVQGELLDDPAGAEQSYQEVLALREDEPESALVAARALEHLLVGNDRDEELAQNLRDQIALEPDLDQKSELLARLAHLSSDVLDDNQAAIDAWEQRLSEHPDDSEALSNLTDLYEKTERFEQVARVLEQRRDSTLDDQERVNLARHLADIQERHLGNATLAIESYQSIFDDAGPDPEVLSALARLFLKTERWEELADIFEKQADVLADEVERLSALAKLGQLRVEHLSDVPGALEAYRRALSVDMAHVPSRKALSELLEHEDNLARLEAAEILHPIYEADGDNEKLLRVLDVEASSSDDPSFRLERYETALRISEDSLKDAARAFEFAVLGTKEAVALGDIDSWLSALERLAPATSRRKDHVAVLEQIVGEMFDVEKQLDVQRRIAELKATELDDMDGAVEAYRKALEFAPEDNASLVALEKLFQQSGRNDELKEVLETRIALSETDEERVALLFRKARLQRDQMQDLDGAIETFESLLDIELHQEAIDAVEALYQKAERFDDLIALIQRRIDEDAGATVDLRVELARVAALHQSDLERALDELEQALFEEAQHQGAVDLLTDLLERITDPALKGRAASLLEPVFMVRADYDKVLEVLSLRLEGSDSPDERRELVTRIAQIHEEQREDYVAALEINAQLLADDPTDELTLEEMERLAKVAGAELRLAELYESQASRVEVDDEASARLCRRAGEVFARHGKDDQALALLKRALAFEPESVDLFEGVDELLKKIGTSEERVELYRTALEHRYDPEEQQKLLKVIADLEERKLGNVEAAIEAHRRAVETDDTNEESLDALTRLYTQTEDYTSLIELYERRAETALPEDAAEFRIALSDLHMRKLGAHEPALDQLEEVVRDLPDYEPAIVRLEAMRASEQLRGRVVEILRPIYQARDDWRRLIQLNEDRFSLCDDPMDQVAILRETAEFWELRGDAPGRAQRVLSEALKLQPEDEDVRSEIERLAPITGNFAELAELYDSILSDHPELLGRLEMVARLAEVHDKRLDDPRRALNRYLEVREEEPGDPEFIDAALRLSLLLGDWKVFESQILAKLDVVYDDAERAELYLKLGDLRQKTLEQVELAIEAYERAWETDDQNPDICDRLIALYENRNEPGRLVDLYVARVESESTDDDLKFLLLTRAAKLLETSLGDAPRAIECLTQALLARPGDAETVSELNRLYRAEEMWPDLLDNLRLEAGTAESTDQRLSIRHEIARILADKMESFDDALEAFAVILDERPDDTKAIAAVFELVEHEEHLARQAANLLVPALRQTTLRAELVRALNLRLTDEQEPSSRVETLRSIAVVEEQDLRDPKAALESYLRAIAETPENIELHDEAERLAAQVDGYARYAEALKARAADVFDSEVAGGLWARLGRVFEERLDEKREAVDAYQAACEQVGDRLDLLDALDRLYTALGDTDAVVELLERRMMLAESDADQAKILCRQGQLRLDEQNDAAEALSAFRSALERDLHNQEASDQLLRLLSIDQYFEDVFEILDGVYRDRSAGKELAALHERRVRRAESPEERLDMRRGLAQVLEEECQDPMAAQMVLEEGLADDPTDEGLRDEIERLLPLTGAWDRAARALLAATTGQTSLEPDVGRDLCERAATWLRDQAQNLDGAETALLRASEFDPDSDEILEQLQALQNVEGKELELVATLRKRAGLALDEGSKVEFLRQAHERAENLGKSELAEELLREILDSDPDDLLALQALCVLRKAASDHEETFDLLLQRADLETDPDRLKALKLEAANLARDELKQPDEAIEILQEIFEDDPNDTDVAAALREAYSNAERYDELSELITKMMDSVTDPAELADLRVAQAKLKRDQLGDLDEAIVLLREVFDADPTHTEAGLLLTEAYENTENHAELADILLQRVGAARASGDEGVAATLLRQVARIYEEKLDDLDQAIEMWKLISEGEDTLEVLESILRLQLLSGRKEDAAASLEEICLSVDEGQKLVRRAELVELYRELGDVDAVIRTIEGSVELAPSDEELRASLRTEYESAGAWEKVADLIVSDSDRAKDLKERVTLLQEAAAIHSDKRKDVSSAVPLLEKAAELAPDDRDLQLLLCDTYSGSGRGDEAIAVLQRIVDSYGGKRSKELGEIHRRLATAYLSKHENEKALEELDRAFRIEPGNIFVLKQLGEVALEVGDMKKAQQMFRALLLQRLDESSPITKAEVFCRLGEVHQRLGEAPKAKQMFERALQAEPEMEAAKAGLASL